MTPDFDTAMARVRRLPRGLLLDAAREDQDCRWAVGERVPAEAYFAALPALATEIDDAMVLIYGEVMCRVAAGETIQLEDFTKRFPHLTDRLGPLLEVHAGLTVGVTPQTVPALGHTPDPPVPVIEGLGMLVLVARGGMGRVYRAVDLATGHPVGVKVVEHDDASPETLVRFLQEGEILARLDHPNIVRLIRCGSHAGGLHIVMEWVDGGTLATHCGRQHTPAQAAALVARVADAVEYAHRRGVIHRDLKPANILLTGAKSKGHGGNVEKEPDPPPIPRPFFLAAMTPKVADFGIARLAVAGRTVTATGQVLGTAAFMPPEQVLGRHDEIGPASDVYALGAILYVLLTGVTPFEGRHAVEVIQKVVADDPVPPSVLAPGVPVSLSETCLRCLAKSQATRFTSAAGLADVLRQASA